MRKQWLGVIPFVGAVWWDDPPLFGKYIGEFARGILYSRALDVMGPFWAQHGPAIGLALLGLLAFWWFRPKGESDRLGEFKYPAIFAVATVSIIAILLLGGETHIPDTSSIIVLNPRKDVVKKAFDSINDPELGSPLGDIHSPYRAIYGRYLNAVAVWFKDDNARVDNTYLVSQLFNRSDMRVESGHARVPPNEYYCEKYVDAKFGLNEGARPPLGPIAEFLELKKEDERNNILNWIGPRIFQYEYGLHGQIYIQNFDNGFKIGPFPTWQWADEHSEDKNVGSILTIPYKSDSKITSTQTTDIAPATIHQLPRLTWKCD